MTPHDDAKRLGQLISDFIERKWVSANCRGWYNGTVIVSRHSEQLQGTGSAPVPATSLRQSC